MRVEYYVIKDVQLNGSARSVEELSSGPANRHDQLRYRRCIPSVCATEGAGSRPGRSPASVGACRTTACRGWCLTRTGGPAASAAACGW